MPTFFMNDEKNTGVKRYTAGNLFGWVFGVIAAIVGVVWLFSQPIAGLLTLIIAGILLPPVNRMVEDRYQFAMSGGLKAVFIIVLLVIAGFTMSDTPPSAEQPSRANEDTSLAADDATTPGSFGDGTHIVGQDIDAGVYRSDGSGSCYWARLAGFSGELADIIANGNNTPEIVAIDDSDAAFETRGCGRWVPVESTVPDSAARSFEDGTHQVGGHIEPGTYRSNTSGSCYWARLSNFSHAGVDGIITNGNTPTVVEISSQDAGFTTFGCGLWSQI